MPDALPRQRRSAFGEITLRGGVLTARIAGPSVAEREATVLAAEIAKALGAAGRSARVLVLDLRDVEMLASIGLGLLIDTRNRAAAFGAPTVVYGLRPRVAELVHLMKVERLFRIAQTDAELKKALVARAG